MADPETQIAPTDAEEGEEAASGGLKPKLKIGGFMLLIVGVECAGAYMFFPSSSDTMAAAQSRYGGESALDAEADELLEDEQDIQGRKEVDLGEFSVTAFQPISNTTLRIDFHLFGTVMEDDEDDCMDLLAEHQHRYREQVLVILRSAEITDLTDAGLGLIKRKILEKSNRALGKPLFQEIIFSQFSFVEQ